MVASLDINLLDAGSDYDSKDEQPITTSSTGEPPIRLACLVGAHDVIVAAIARCGVARAPIADWPREGKCRQLPGQMRR